MGGGNLEDKFGAMWKQCGHPWRPTRIQAFKWIKDLTKGITFLHNCHIPIVHRDLKPANLLLTDEDHLKVADFGLCKTLQKVQVDGKPYTMTGKTGTMRYMAPEVVKSEPFYDEKVDIYSMAMIFWYILHGVRPFEGVQPNLVAELTSCRGIRPSLEGLYWPEMANMISRMWSDKPSDRPSSKAILDELNSMCVEDLNGSGSASEHKCSSKGCVPCAIM
jgi:serine/threonine protein kinase